MAQTTTDNIIKVSNLTVGYGTNIVLKDLNFSVKRGEIFVILGGSGCGKSSLLKNMIGYSEDGQMSMKAAQNVYKVLRQFEPSVIAAGDAIKLENTFDNNFAKKAAAKYR